MTFPGWALMIAYWLHMLATVIWVGGLAALSIFVLPAARKSLDGAAFPSFLADVQRRLDPLAWFCLGLLGATGLFQMSSNPNYQGFLKLENTWAAAILAKHILFLGMAGISAYMTWGLLPGLRRTVMQQSLETKRQTLEVLQPDPAMQGKRSSQKAGSEISQQELRLLRLNLALGIVVLALTAIARAS